MFAITLLCFSASRITGNFDRKNSLEILKEKKTPKCTICDLFVFEWIKIIILHD